MLKLLKPYTIRLLILLLVLINSAYALELQVKISGVNKELEKSLSNSLQQIEKFNKNKNLNLSIGKIENLHQMTLKKIKYTLAAYGYYNSNIIGSLTEVRPNKTWRSSYDIQLGPATKISNINLRITGAAASNPFFKHYKIQKLKTNTILIHKNYEDAKEELIILLQEYGFLSAKYTSTQLRVDRNKHTVEVILFIDSGQQYVFGTVTYVNPSLELSYLNRFIPFKTGEPYTAKKIMEFRNNLNTVDQFEKVKIDPLPDFINKNNVIVPINVTLTPKKNKRYTGSVGYGTDTGIRGAVAWRHRRITNTGHKISASISGSKIRKKGQINYIIPGKQPANDSYVLNSTLQQENIEDIYFRKAELGISKNKTRENYIRIWSAKRLFETFKDLQQNKNTNVQFLLGEAYYSFSNIEKKEEREYGHSTEISIIAASDKLFSEVNLFKVRLDNKFVYPLVTDFRLILKNSLGTIVTPNFAVTPMSLRYFAGGEDTIRGFRRDSIGQEVLDKNGNTVNIGGKNLFLFSAEIDKPVWEKLSIAIFVDTGSAGNRFTSKLSTGAGVGLRWSTAIGSLKFDIAKPISNTFSQKKVRFHITFGTDL
jgi:translocation and assembly module TamA